ncbi:MAG: NapC/NirT family cytochrome c, partial [Candidatus Omnitrophica bacterium]|nr:NapC/NirT family cytochrome c [Candidatus Omnitrophota bacterium]
MNKTSSRYSFSHYFYNTQTYIGVVLSLVVFLVELLLFCFDYFSQGLNIYLGIITYVILPPFLILGLILIPWGAFRKKRLISKGLTTISPRKFTLDFSLASHRNGMVVFIFGSICLIVMTTIGSYKAYKYTESVSFCGLTCHQVMSPQHTAYLNSPHAKVKCIDCHVGEGANWYIHYKLAGVRQMYHFMKGDYPRPIPTPVEGLRPAAETCEHCHWTEKFYNTVEIDRSYYSAESDAESARKWLIRMLVHVGKNNDKGTGIHAHMYLDHDIYYAAEDKERQNISWVKSVAKDGTSTIFTTEDSKFKDTPPGENTIRKMDCIDCHNRPTHHFNPPYLLINRALTQNEISAQIPEIKAKLMEVLSAEYTTQQQASDEIRQKLTEFYGKNYAEYYNTHKADIEKAIEKTIALFNVNFFPEMKTRWDNRPDNIGHFWSPGCFRCHDGNHASDSGKVITKDCTVCHTILEQGPVGAIQSSTAGLEFVHPFDDSVT